MDQTDTLTDGWQVGDASQSYVYIAPEYVRQVVKLVWDTYYPKGGILLSEFGFPVQNEALKTLPQEQFDIERSLYYRGALNEILKAISEDGVKMIGTFGWSFLDNNEFSTLTTHFGMQAVNRTNGLFTRYYKRSLFDWVDFFHTHISGARDGTVEN